MTIIIEQLTHERVCDFSHALLNIAQTTIDYPPEALAYYQQRFSPESLADQLENTIALYIQNNGKIEAVLFGTMAEGGVATIIWLLVNKKFQGEGYGRALFNAAKSQYLAMGTHKIKLTAPNKSTLAFYQKQGMVKEGFHSNHWWNMDIFSLGIQIR